MKTIFQMNKIRPPTWFILLALFMSAPLTAAAATITFEADAAAHAPGSTFAVDVYVDTDDEDINAIEGRIGYSLPALGVRNIYHGDSLVTLWLDEPAARDGVITFSGIIPGGVRDRFRPAADKTQRMKLFTIVMEHAPSAMSSSVPGAAPAVPSVFLASGAYFFNDGAAEPRRLAESSLRLSIDASLIPTEYKMADAVPPEPFVVALERGVGGTAGTRYAVFAASDKGAGVGYYEACEIWLVRARAPGDSCVGKWIVTDSPYAIESVFTGKVYIKAVDNAGNTRISELSITRPTMVEAALITTAIAIFAVLAAALYAVMRLVRLVL